MDHDGPLKELRKPFPPNQISKLPKESRTQIEARKANRDVAINCNVCGGWHHKSAVHLDYVGHAALTDRLLDADIAWSWEPVAFNAEGLPAFDRTGGLWIKLTVAGVTRLGYGAADGKSGGDAVKEIIGDAMRNAAMRFGAALDLWHKGDLHAEEDEPKPEVAPEPEGPKPREVLEGPHKSMTALKGAYQQLDRNIRQSESVDDLDGFLELDTTKALIDQLKRYANGYVVGSDKLPAEHVPLEKLIEQTRASLQAIQDEAERQVGAYRAG